MQRLYDLLVEYSKSGYIPFHMPGHKRALMEFENPYSFDITEIDGFDNLHHAEGILKEAQKYASVVCQADETHFLVNGSTCGILSAIFSAADQNGEVLVARNCHKAVYHAVELRRLKAHYIYPEMLPEGILGEITVKMIEESLEKYPEAKTLILTSPTYDGVISDIRNIVKAAHARGVSVIVDEAHGAHFLKESGFPKSAVRCGADVVIQSTHKTLPALTQTALLHVNKDYRHKEKLRKYLTVFQTSSPSYVLMASIDACMHWYIEEGRECFCKYMERLKKLREKLSERLNVLELIIPENVFNYDISKILISVRKAELTGVQFHERLLKDYHIQAEMVSAEYVLFMTSVADREEDYEKFFNALIEIDAALEKTSLPKSKAGETGQPKVILPIWEAVEKEKRAVSLYEGMGEICGSYVSIYPPGIPLLVPGEKINDRCVQALLFSLEQGLEIHGLNENQEIEIIWEEYFT